MKKMFVFYFLLFLIIIILPIVLLLNFKKQDKKISDNKRFSFYKEELKERYDLYKKKNPDLEEIDVITRVNLNLDKEFYTDVKESKDLNKSYILVNKYNYLKEHYIPDNLALLDNCSLNNKYLVKEAKENFELMCQDLKKENLHLRVISSYRGYNYQKTLYDNYVLKDGKEKADTYSARPGFSEHQTGLVIDVDNGKNDFNNFEDTKEFEWMINNSYKYGFILRYPYGKENITGYSYESWHYRYVGKEVSEYIFHNDLTLDEYYARFIDIN